MGARGFSEEEWEVLREIARMLRYFAVKRQYGYIDRLANSYSPRAASLVVQEALRDARSAQASGERVHIPSEDAVRRFFDLVYRRGDAAKVVAALALAYPGSG